jgi:hypothetical protein
MNPENNHDEGDLGSRVGDGLHRSVDRLHESPFTLDDVKGRAGSIRRTRRLATAAGIAAAVAVIVPVAVFASHGLGDDDRTLPPLTQSPNPSPTRATDTTSPSPSPTTPTQEPGRGDLPTYSLAGDFPTGSPPALPYLDGTRLLRHDHAPLALPRAYDGFVLLGDRVVGSYQDGSGNRMVDVVEGDGSVSLTSPLEGGLALSDAGTTVAWGTPDGTIETAWSDGQVQLARGLGEPVTVAAVVGDGSCYEVDGGCRALFNSSSFGDPPRAADSHGIVDIITDQPILKVNDASPSGLVAVQTSSSDTGSCSGVLDERKQDYVFTTCDNTLRRFSPSGGLLLGSDPYLDGVGLGSLTVLDVATGDPVVTFPIRGGIIADEAWEDEEHLLVVTHEDSGWRVLRVGLDGTIEVAAGPQVTEDDLARPYSLPH